MDPPAIDGARCENDDFISVFDAKSEYIAASSSSESGGSGAMSDTEQELLLVFLTK